MPGTQHQLLHVQLLIAQLQCHDLALALGEGDARGVRWAADDPRLAVYLSGADLPAAELPADPDGWLLIAVDGFGLGWGKRAAGRLKNHYPRALRR